MKIVFDKVGQIDKPFYKEQEGVVFEGFLQKNGANRVTLLGKIEGSLTVQCNRCGTDYAYTVATPIKLTISDQIVEDKDDLDIIEFLDGEIDISFILESEMNTLKSEYHYCDKCDKEDEAFEMEF